MHTCSQCHIAKPFVEFRSTNLQTCKACQCLAAKESNKTPMGLIRRIYGNQRMTCRKMNRPVPNYSCKELQQWVHDQPHFQTLYTDWVNSGYQKELIPSIDRIENHKSYTLTNIQLVTWQKKKKNQKTQNIAGTFLHTGSKAVRQLDPDGTLIMEHPSISCAMRHIKGKSGTVSNISNVCNGKWPTAYGYRWEWA